MGKNTVKIVAAEEKDFQSVRDITQNTIAEIYPKYYPEGAVRFFANHHSDEHIREDIKSGIVFLLLDGDDAVGTVTISGQEMKRLFVLPERQHRGYGRALLDFAEAKIHEHYDSILLDASLPAKELYLKRGYAEVEYHQILTDRGDYLCYDVMQKKR